MISWMLQPLVPVEEKVLKRSVKSWMLGKRISRGPKLSHIYRLNPRMYICTWVYLTARW